MQCCSVKNIQDFKIIKITQCHVYKLIAHTPCVELKNGILDQAIKLFNSSSMLRNWRTLQDVTNDTCLAGPITDVLVDSNGWMTGSQG